MNNINEQAISKLYLKDTAFANLMQRRIFNVLLVATPYDAFMMEEDGRVEEQVYFEYVSLNLSSPPRFTKVATFEEAHTLLRNKEFDLIIAMPGVDISETFTEARKIKVAHPDTPFVVLTPFSKEVSRRLQNEDLSAVDYVFSWLGNVDLILAIIKLLEDRMNAPKDIEEVGVQAILLVEDSVRFYSAVLPYLFKFLLNQSKEFSTEALNEHEQMLRMRGRPKVILARDFEEAKDLYEKYSNRMLGIVTDVSFPREGVKDKEAGLKFSRYVRSKDATIPIIVESSEIENKDKVGDFGGIFIDKTSKTLPQELRRAVRNNFGFGDFVVKDPATGAEIMHIRNLKDLQKNIYNIPGDSLFFHSSTNDISRWLYSRALFPIASALKTLRFTDMSQAPALRKLIFEVIVKYRRMKNRGVVAVFKKDRFDKYSNFARIGQGSMGGKGRGLAFIDSIIKRHPECENFHGVQITIPRTVVLCTDIFDEFMDTNDLYPIALSNTSDDEILQTFLKGSLPEAVCDDLRALFEVIDKPLAVRSSSLLEDSHYQPFAGVYSTYMIPRLADPERMLKMVTDAIKGVYASVFFTDSKAYMNATRNVIDQEKMAVILQEVAGETHDGYYYPSFAGVGRSINYYPVGNETPEEGVAEVAVGLGKYIVDGSRALRFSPAHPESVLQTSTLDLALRDTQTQFYALPATDPGVLNFTVHDDFNIKRLNVADAVASGAMKYMVSTYDGIDHIMRDTDQGRGRKVVTFANILRHNVFPLAECVKFMLSEGQYEMGRPVEIEFAGCIDPKASPSSEQKGTLYWLQIRPIVDKKEMLDDSIMNHPDSELLLRSDTALGHGLMDNVRHVAYVRPQSFDSTHNSELAREVETLNRGFIEKDQGYILIGPGRWGSSDPALGIPVKWPQIAGARLIVETALPGYNIEPSQGTHFFQNLTSFGVGYFTISPASPTDLFDIDYLEKRPAVYESERLRVVEFDSPLPIAINGRKSIGIVLKESFSTTDEND
ncbi:MAG: phosphoenolpyruvate synthase [Prevotella sp.]|nr:phosphoenolpyruvate synthase [Prevotella sp.]MCM1074521.1 phosphoenolpyruvate synthase [Ruminococcus sp.]